MTAAGIADEMVVIRRERPGDREDIFRIHTEAFEQEFEARLVNVLREEDELKISLVAEVGGRIVGHIGFSEVTINSEVGGGNAIGLAPLAVLPDYQRQGIGSQLVREGLALAARIGYSIAVVLGHPAFYPRFGFLPARRFGIRWEFDCPPETFMVKELQDNALLGVRGKVRFHPLFSEMD